MSEREKEKEKEKERGREGGERERERERSESRSDEVLGESRSVRAAGMGAVATPPSHSWEQVQVGSLPRVDAERVATFITRSESCPVSIFIMLIQPSLRQLSSVS